MPRGNGPTMSFSAFDDHAMRRALEIAPRGAGLVEPNPQVGAVVAADGRIVGEGWHARFGGPHAEAAALAAAGPAARGSTLYVTLEPCCHHGKTPPCTDAIRAAGVARVVVAAGDPHPAVAGGGITALRSSGIAVETGLCAPEALRLTAPFRKRVTTGTPWLIAKWALSLDGRFSTAPGQDRWISSPDSRRIVHELRERVDAIVVGIGTVLADDPLLTARPAADRPPLREPLRVVLDSRARLPVGSALVRTARRNPVLVAAGPTADAAAVTPLRAAGCEVWQGAAEAPELRFAGLLEELGRRGATNVLVEGGPTVLDALFAAGAVDEFWAFVAPRIIGAAVGTGHGPVPPASATLAVEEVSRPGGDILIRGLVRRG